MAISYNHKIEEGDFNDPEFCERTIKALEQYVVEQGRQLTVMAQDLTDARSRIKKLSKLIHVPHFIDNSPPATPVLPRETNS